MRTKLNLPLVEKLHIRNMKIYHVTSWVRLLLPHSGLLLFNEHPSGAAKAGKRFLDRTLKSSTNDQLS